MCFSPEMDATAGVVVTLIGVDTLRRVKTRNQIALAALPVLFGVHQLVETFVWLQLQGHVAPGIGDIAAWIYLLIAMVAVPVAVPYAFLRLGSGRWPRLDLAFVLAGAVAAAAHAYALLAEPHRRMIEGHQISYLVHLPMDSFTLPLYVIAVCGPGLAARSRILQAFAVANLVGVVTLVALNQNGVISLWCVWAALTSVLINLYIRGFRLPLSSNVLTGTSR
ncbi:MAG: hypothetical protein L0H93_11870 [Nocardioides sp.]|nr:hypothetical protein [Nocardioides sp.]